MADDVSNAPLIAFYRGQMPDAGGRLIDEIWHWNFRRLEIAHDYIQWLFPLPEPSRFNADAPCLSAAEARLFHVDDELQARLGRSLEMMLGFYGFARRDRAIMRDSNFKERARNWLTPLNHNHLRLTRILLALGYLGRRSDAEALFACLADIARHEGREAISDRTSGFWQSAIENPPPLQ